MDAVMHSFGFIILYIFPPPSSNSTVGYDLDKLHRSFVTLVEEDYPLLVGELHVDPQTGIVNVKQSPERRQRGAQEIRFETNPNNSMTTEEAIKMRTLDLMPTQRSKMELICAKGTLLADGGLVIGVDASHTLFDGEAMFTFMTVWGQHYSGKNVSAVQVGTNFVFGPDLMFTSWVHMGMYNAEFDGTHPWYACVPRIPCYDGFNMITEARKGGDGVDVGVFLESGAMERLKKLYAEVEYLHE
ncbi:hypothetical protein BBO99_00005218 [Phytophthora kernoviae]|uniref:Condensation domain-containing protein n=1 Tax=Phytophthora kernoviae TaxID=325452 RepID=A0A3R7HI66_9STRA|nr:hypothetical protein BBI17_001698 [Phytophthora kernoviae]RLN79514.1 hypothetical protein BBO99_00005218 [Phytophthora kernoviae]